MKVITFFLAVTVSMSQASPPVAAVERVDLSKYIGLWNELYRVPNRFQDNSSSTKTACYNTTAEYAPREGKISVTNTCTRTIDGNAEQDIATALASIVPGSGDAKLVVNFTGLAVLRWLGIGDGNYWILGLGAETGGKYSWALVGEPSRKYGWILSRKLDLPTTELEKIFRTAEANGYQRSQFIPTQKR
ncbi:lipocalin family protein [bacterium]|nr:lipocalin family protein [bacterium]